MKIKELIEKLEQKRFGFCYDSFIETHATPDESPIIAKSFTELLEKLVSNEKEWFWLDSSFQSYGDAYEDEWVSCSPHETSNPDVGHCGTHEPLAQVHNRINEEGERRQ